MLSDYAPLRCANPTYAICAATQFLMHVPIYERSVENSTAMLDDTGMNIE